ncbi:MAG TPA: hypothetical protein VK875_01500 [Euzebyales bacterium]|nr:hypothetical protein [Euzebyales bacterium]
MPSPRRGYGDEPVGQLSAGARLESHGNGINLRATRERPAGEGRTRARTDLDDDVIVIP